jgi:hypothetical protein
MARCPINPPSMTYQAPANALKKAKADGGFMLLKCRVVTS